MTDRKKYYSGRSLQDSKRVNAAMARKTNRAKQNKQKLKEASVRLSKNVFAITILIAVVLLILSRLIITGQKVEFQSDITNDIEKYENYISNKLSENLLYKVKPFFPEDKLIEDLLATYPEIKEINVSQSLFTTVNTYKITLREPVAFFEYLNKKLAIDSNGVLYNSQVNEGNLPLLISKTKIDYKPGDSAISRLDLQHMAEFKDQLQTLGLNVASIEIGEQPRQYQINLDGKNYKIIVSTQRSVNGQIDELDDSLKFLKSKNITINKYIDLRVADTAYYQ